MCTHISDWNTIIKVFMVGLKSSCLFLSKLWTWEWCTHASSVLTARVRERCLPTTTHQCLGHGESWPCGRRSGRLPPMASYSTSEIGCLYKSKLILQKHTRRLAGIGHYMITMLIVEEGMGHYKSLKTGKFSVKLCLLEVSERLPPWNLMSASSILLIRLNVCFCEIPFIVFITIAL